MTPYTTRDMTDGVFDPEHCEYCGANLTSERCSHVRTVVKRAWSPRRIAGRWSWLALYLSTQVWQLDYSGWSTGDWVTIEREALP
jgi:hypothetical protein